MAPWAPKAPIPSPQRPFGHSAHKGPLCPTSPLIPTAAGPLAQQFPMALLPKVTREARLTYLLKFWNNVEKVEILILDAGSRRGETGFSRGVFVKAENFTRRVSLKGGPKIDHRGVSLNTFADFCFNGTPRGAIFLNFSLTNPPRAPAAPYQLTHPYGQNVSGSKTARRVSKGRVSSKGRLGPLEGYRKRACCTKTLGGPKRTSWTKTLGGSR